MTIMWQETSTHTRIKLCLFEHLEAAYEASQLGPDALGFHILKADKESWDKKAEAFRTFLQVLPRSVQPTLLIDHSPEITLRCLAVARFPCVQLYPDWEPDIIQGLRASTAHPFKILKVLSAQAHENDPSDFAAFLARYSPVADGFLLDSCREGGSGTLADLSVCADIVRMSKRPVFLAGGLTPENVGEAIRAVRPFGVDVETGVSDRVPGIGLLKNIRKCAAFVDAVRQADRALLNETHHDG